MQVPEPSRRQVLGGLFAWLWPGKTESAAPPATPVPIETPMSESLLSVTTFTYDAGDKYFFVVYDPPHPAKLPLSYYDNLPLATTYTYHADG